MLLQFWFKVFLRRLDNPFDKLISREWPRTRGQTLKSFFEHLSSSYLLLGVETMFEYDLLDLIIGLGLSPN